MKRLISFLREEEGMQMTEEAIMLGVVAVVSIPILILLGGYVSGVFTSVSTAIAPVPGA